jgi:hypothetical protein
MQSGSNAKDQWRAECISLSAAVTWARLLGGAAIRLHAACLVAGMGRARALRGAGAVGLLYGPSNLARSPLPEAKNASHALSREVNAKPALLSQVSGGTGLRRVLQVLERWSRVKMHRMPSLAPNPSFERTAFSRLHKAVVHVASCSRLKAAAQLQRWAPAVERLLFGRGSACEARAGIQRRLPAQRFVQRSACARGASSEEAFSGPHATASRCSSCGALQSPKVSLAELGGK